MRVRYLHLFPAMRLEAGVRQFTIEKQIASLAIGLLLLPSFVSSKNPPSTFVFQQATEIPSNGPSVNRKGKLKRLLHSSQTWSFVRWLSQGNGAPGRRLKFGG